MRKTEVLVKYQVVFLKPIIMQYDLMVVIFFSWGGKMLRKFESLMIMLLSASIASLIPPSSGGLNMLLYRYLTNTFNNNFGNNCGST